MVYFRFVYKDGSRQDFDHIIRAEYISFEKVVVNRDELLSHHFPIGKTIHLFSETESYAVSGENVKVISVVKED